MDSPVELGCLSDATGGYALSNQPLIHLFIHYNSLVPVFI